MGYPPQSHARMPREILKEHPEVEIRNDLIDCGVDICSLEVSLSCPRLYARSDSEITRSPPYFKIISITRISEPISCMVS